MTTTEPLTLGGCAPTPLASYLKAIGALRLISSNANHVDGNAADPDARGWWENDQFQLSTRLSREELCGFFLQEYAPTPIVAPWNGGSGFYEKDNKDGFDPLYSGKIAKRFTSFANAIRHASEIVNRHGLDQSPKDVAKAAFVAELRAAMPDDAVDWIDAALALSGSGLEYPQLLGTGGNDGRLDFTSNFMRRLVSKRKGEGIFDSTSGQHSKAAPSLLASSLFDVRSNDLMSAAVGQFSPGAAGGPNSTSGFEGGARVNPWDFVFTLEGAVAFASAATRRHPGAPESGASFPFTVRQMVGAGWGGVEAADEDNARAEFWAPLWRRPARFVEVKALFSEGRAVLNGRTARSGLDFARAACSLGTSRGFNEFVRYGFLMRAGKAYLATPLGRCAASSSQTAALVADLDDGGWLDRLRRAGRRDGEPAAARRTIKRLEDALFDLVDGSIPTAKIQRTIIALGEICGWLGVSEKGRAEIGPPPVLSKGWIQLADDGSPEFRVAVALAGIGLKLAGGQDEPDKPAQENSSDDQAEPNARAANQSTPRTRPAPPMAAHFVPIDEASFFESLRRRRKRRAWSDQESSPSVVWGTGGLATNMISVLERRLVEGVVRGHDDKPLEGAIYARFPDVGAFLVGDFDDARCASLLRGLIWARPIPPRVSPLSNGQGGRTSPAIPFAYAALKLVFTPDRTLRNIGALSETARLPIPNGLIARMRAAGGSRRGHATNLAVGEALARARGSGMPSPFGTERTAGFQAGDAGNCIGAGLRADRLAASLLIPISEEATKLLVERAFPGVFPDYTDESTEVTNHAA